MHSFENFKNFAHASINLFKPLTVLLGRNGSGKSNLIEGVELFGALAAGASLNEMSDVGRGGSLEIRGGLGSCVRFGQKEVRFGFTGAFIRFEGKRQRVRHFIELAKGAGDHIQVVSERLKIGNKILIDATSDGGELLTVSYANFSSGRNPQVPVTSSRSVLSRFEEIARNSNAKGDKLQLGVKAVRLVQQHLQRAYIFDPQPKAMRDYVRTETHPELFKNGMNLSAVLLALKKGDQEQQAVLQRITEFIRQIPEEPLVGIDFVETPLGDVMAGFLRTEEVPERLVDARLLSDGTLRTLAIMTALETVPERSRIVVEEFDNGVHPSRASLMVQAFEEAATRRKLNIVLTTHNPAFMDAIDEKRMDSVLVSHFDETLGGFKVTPLGDLEFSKTLSLQGGLGDYVTRGALESHLSPSFEDNRRDELKQWLASLQ